MNIKKSQLYAQNWVRKLFGVPEITSCKKKEKGISYVKKERVVRMIKNKEKIRKELKEKLTKMIDTYVDDMDKKSDGEYYPIDVIEADLVKIQKDAKEIIKQTTEELLSSVDEEKEITKKN